jgi:hypothetical protein
VRRSLGPVIPSRTSLPPARRLARRAVTAVLAAAAAAALAAPTTALAADDRPAFVIAVLGDSYASGEGSPDVHGNHSWLGDLFAPECLQIPFTPAPCYPEKWWAPDAWYEGREAFFPQQDDEGWQDDARRCHRSSKAPGPHAAMLLAERFRDVRIEVLDFACGGSEIGPGMLEGWAGPEPPFGAPNLGSQIHAVRDYAAATGRHIDATVVNIGGNDGEFAELVKECLNIVSLTDDCSNNQTLNRIRFLSDDKLAPPYPHVNAAMSERYARMNTVIEQSSNAAGRPDELYLTALPNPAHDAPPADAPAGTSGEYCDGTQTTDPWYKNATRNESVAIEGVVAGLNLAMDRAAARHGWTFMSEMFDDWEDHGICAGAQSFFRTNDKALKYQGDEGLIAPHISPGIAHGNENGYKNRAARIADALEAHMRMSFRAPVLQLDGVEPGEAFKVSWTDPSPKHLAETRWELRMVSGGSMQGRGSDASPGQIGFVRESAKDFSWRVPETGEFQVRVRGCRRTRGGGAHYCGPFSEAITVVNAVPGTPQELRRVALLPLDDKAVAHPIRLAWSAGAGTPPSTTYEVQYRRPADQCTITPLGGCPSATATTTSTRIALPGYGEWLFRIRACSAAGCSPYSGSLTAEVSRL